MLFSEDQENTENFHLETTAMVDVIFILLAFFVVVSQLKEYNLPLQLTPTQTGKSPSTKEKSLVLQINGKDEIFLAKKKVTLDELGEILKMQKPMPVQLRSDQNSKSGTFLKVLDLLKKYDFRQLNISVDKKNSPQ